MGGGSEDSEQNCLSLNLISNIMYSSNFKAVVDYIDDLIDIPGYRSCCYAWMDEGDGVVLVSGGDPVLDIKKWWLRLYLDIEGIKVDVEDGCLINRSDMEFFRNCYNEIDVIKDLYYKAV